MKDVLLTVIGSVFVTMVVTVIALARAVRKLRRAFAIHRITHEWPTLHDLIEGDSTVRHG